MNDRPYDDMPEGVYKHYPDDGHFRGKVVNDRDMRDLGDIMFSPGSGTKPKRRKSKRIDLEGPVVKECLLLLMEHPDVVYYERRSTGMLPTENGMVRFGAVGAADIWCLVGANIWRSDRSQELLEHVEIECKRRDGKGRLSDNQKKFRDKCYIAGIPYVVVTSAEELSQKIAKLTA